MTQEAAYLSVADFRLRSIMPTQDVDTLESLYPGFIAVRLLRNSVEVNARLGKRYAVPFVVADCPEIVKSWVVDLTTLDAYARRGFNPASEQDQAVIIMPADRAREQMKEAADSNEGLYDLPLRTENAEQSGITFGAPLTYSEQSPYTAAKIQRQQGELEDEQPP